MAALRAAIAQRRLDDFRREVKDGWARSEAAAE
jgi:hypothetical protein